MGIVLYLSPQDARSEHPADVAEARLADGRVNRWFLDPLAGRGYPTDVVEATAWNGTVILPGDLETIAVATDMVGANYYTRQIVQSPTVVDAERPPPIRAAGPEITSMGWEVYPEGMYRVLDRLREYGHRHIYVTESGAAYPDEFAAGAVADKDRLDYHRRYLAQVGRACCRRSARRGVLCLVAARQLRVAIRIRHALRAHPGRLRIPAAHGQRQRPMVRPGGREQPAHRGRDHQLCGSVGVVVGRDRGPSCSPRCSRAGPKMKQVLRSWPSRRPRIPERWANRGYERAASGGASSLGRLRFHRSQASPPSGMMMIQLNRR